MKVERQLVTGERRPVHHRSGVAFLDVEEGESIRLHEHGTVIAIEHDPNDPGMARIWIGDKFVRVGVTSDQRVYVYAPTDEPVEVP